MELLEKLLKDYAIDTDVLPSDLHDKIIAGLVYWQDLDFQNLGLEDEPKKNERINKTLLMQGLLSSLSQLVMEDSLTGLYNRRYFNRALKSEVERSSREQRSLGLGIIDIDHFKSVNDTLGHDGGDQVLKSVANIMDKKIRKSDTLIRIGGEEFAVLMPNIRPRVAKDVMDRLRIEIENSVIPVNSNNYRVTVSIGVVVNEPTRIISDDEFYKQADQALYQAKKTGRNKVILSRGLIREGLSAAEREALSS